MEQLHGVQLFYIKDIVFLTSSALLHNKNVASIKVEIANTIICIASHIAMDFMSCMHAAS